MCCRAQLIPGGDDRATGADQDWLDQVNRLVHLLGGIRSGNLAYIVGMRLNLDQGSVHTFDQATCHGESHLA
jgi:hypothetical protein